LKFITRTGEETILENCMEVIRIAARKKRGRDKDKTENKRMENYTGCFSLSDMIDYLVNR